MTAESPVAVSVASPIRDRNIRLTFDLARAVLADPAILDDIPNGVTLVLLPHDAETEFVEENIALGLAALREGRDVYFRHLAPSEWSAPPDPSATGSWDDYVVKREYFDPPLDDDAEHDEEPSR